MKTILLTTAILLILAYPTHSQTVMTCEVAGDYIPVGRTFPVDNEPAYIDGSTPGSRVNVRTGPGSGYEADAYGLVGDAVQVIGQAFSTNCETSVDHKLSLLPSAWPSP